MVVVPAPDSPQPGRGLPRPVGLPGLALAWSARRWRPCGRPALPRSRARAPARAAVAPVYAGGGTRAPARRLSARGGVG
ncbi:hypothetical protein HMPREF1978_00203 [Actinomyces graevenitzii F0530]|uniref:Uncharacterized protein n=1 Tax=Actinomyces graevenitzii F0530 TaxID=1321817 RepID=U1RNI6_9ACTO|nr:hypothetical protein HMPREF1978_00203 [Actinomyces graevenitzii F0530]